MGTLLKQTEAFFSTLVWTHGAFHFDSAARYLALRDSIKQLPLQPTAGGKDMVKEEDTKLIASSIPGAQLMILPEEDHSSYIVDSDRIAHILIGFFGSL